MKRDSTSPAAYRADIDGWQRDVVERIRGLVQAGCPGVEEGIKYGMLNSPGIGALAAQKHYVSLYVSPEILERRRKEFPKLACGKSCVRFRRASDLDEAAVRSLLGEIVGQAQ